ncbi:DEKNAAC102432 [Brettanomyces naardenensis]|uniref:DEKNAAC102432 n=1 Tax=Brettanomyces naardenensis TaxID=13370 RepID=A0A448YL84_BRENA|nr:DEKNAAC102432 [Brettanomyces naardenensis]
MVQCPICSKEVPIQLINKHLDECELKGNEVVNVDEDTSTVPSPPAPEGSANPSTGSRKNKLSDLLNGNAKKLHTNQRQRSYQYISAEHSSTRRPSSNDDNRRNTVVISDTEPELEPDSSLSSDGHRDKIAKVLPSSPISAGKARQQEQIRLLKMMSRLPLAERLRPAKLEDFIGQTHVVGKGGILRGFIESDRIPSMILWGYPGTGKTTLARIISHTTKSRFVELSATSNGISDCKKVFEEAKNELKLTGRKTIVFVDEIHRFNKTQQDIFLPHVERGTITLIGATTENPSFQLNSALLSRCRVFVLKKLSAQELKEIICRALVEINKTRKLVYNKSVLRFAPDAIDYLCNISDGDSRGALNLLELADSHYMSEVNEEDQTDAEKNAKTSPPKNKHVIDVTAHHLRDVLKRTQMVYDRVGDAHYDTISAFHKSVRGSCADAALYYLARMLKGGEDPLYIARRMIRIASEDVGVMDETCLPFAVAAYRAVQVVGLPEADLALAQCAVKLARAPKSVEIYRAWGEINSKLASDPDVAAAPIPLHLRNAPTKLMKDLGYSEGYKYNPDFKDGKVKQEYFPKELVGLKLLRGQHLGTQTDPDLL